MNVMKQAMRVMVLVALLVVTLVPMSGCASRGKPRQPSGEGTSTPTSTPPPTPAAVARVRLYFTRAEKIGVAGRDVTVVAGEATATPTFLVRVIEALLQGPTVDEREIAQLGTMIPNGTKVLGVGVDGTTATVDLSRGFQLGGGSLSMQMRAAQVVCTLTQFKEFDRVAFKIEGKKIEALGGEGVKVGPTVNRADFEDMLPAILVESPVALQEVTSPLIISGSSNVFEATHQVNVTDPEGLIVANRTVMATSGTGTRGTWNVSVSFTIPRSGLGAVIVFGYSAKDGSRIDIVEIPVRMTK